MVNYEPELVKGCPEFLPPDSIKYEYIKKIIETEFEAFGFLPVKTPTIEFEELAKAEMLPNEEDEAISDRFKLQDKGGRRLALRHEFTYQLARIFKQNPTIKLPFRRYQIGSNFRDEPTGPGRYKEFTQCDADIIGDDSPYADADCLALTASIIHALDIDAKIHVNNRKLMNAILESLKIEAKASVMRELDKLEKLGEDMVKANLKRYADANQILTLFKLLEKDLSFFVKNLFDGAEELKKIISLGKNYGYKVVYDPLLVRGLSYYTGLTIEVRSSGKFSLGGGGRYEGVAGKFIRRPIPSVGISFGIERLMDIVSLKRRPPSVIVISLGQENEALEFVQEARKAKIATIFSSEKPGKALEYANAYDIGYAVFVGPEEVKKKKIKLKNLQSGEELFLTEKQALQRLSAQSDSSKEDSDRSEGNDKKVD